MRIYISADIEGVCDVVNNEQTSKGGFLYNLAREQMTNEINAAILGAVEAGATEFVVNDSHGSMVNIKPDLLHKNAELILGSKKPLSMMQGINSSFDGVMFIGYHARNNTPGVLSHTIDGGIVDNIWLNNTIVGETGLNAIIAGHYDVPVILLTGDNIVSNEVKELLGEKLETTQVKKAITRYSAKCIHPDIACERIKESAYNSIKYIKNCKPYKLKGPYTGRIQFRNSGFADNAFRLPSSERVNGDTLSYSSDNWLNVIKGLLAMISLSR